MGRSRPTRMTQADAEAVDAARKQLADGLAVLAGMTVGVMHTIAHLQGIPEDQRDTVVRQQLLDALGDSVHSGSG